MAQSVQEGCDHQTVSAIRPYSRTNDFEITLRHTDTVNIKDWITLKIRYNSVFENLLFAKFEH